MKYSAKTVGTLLTGLLVLAGCAAPVSQQEQSGFLTDYSKLELLENNRIVYVSDRAVEYRSFIIDPIVILFERDENYKEFSEKEIENFKAYAVKELTKQFTKDNAYSVVSDPGPGVARFRFGITDVDDTIGVLNVSIYTKITGLGLGGLAIEGELVDSMTGEQLMAAIRWGSGSRILRAGYTHMGDAKIAADRWTHDVRKIFDELHGR